MFNLYLEDTFQNVGIQKPCQVTKTEFGIAWANNKGCYILFEDNGPGIPNKNYEDVFKPFFTLDPSRNKLKGESGLGLAITRDIIRSHGGEIRLDKSKMGGLKTIFQLPI